MTEERSRVLKGIKEACMMERSNEKFVYVLVRS